MTECDTTEGAHYVLGYAEEIVSKLGQRTVGREAAFVLPYLSPRARVLDAGCGPGSITLGLAQRIPKGSVIGVDLNASQIELARRLAKVQGQTNLRFEVTDVAALPFPDASFDVVFAHTLMMHLAQPRKVLAEFQRVCAPGGVICLRDGLGCFEHLPGFPANSRVSDLQALLRACTLAAGGTPDVGLQMKGWLHELGMTMLDARPHSIIYDTPQDMCLVRDWYGSMLRGDLGRQAIASGFLTAQEIATYLERMDRWPMDPAATTIVTWIEHVARKSAV